ncbi:MAG: Xaa-Pro peptidase family protein [Clostridiales bacterium]|jgi:Xaa-Pro aminopeptidase|nr:Xaa-Pro peptidase family protein [Clostridiales bacterium]
MNFPAKTELSNRIEKLYKTLKIMDNDWDFIFITDKINQYYFTGTIQDGVLVLNSAGDIMYFVRRSFERAKTECPFSDCIFPIASYRDIHDKLGKNTRKIYLETEIVTYAALNRMGKYFDTSPSNIASLDKTLRKLRAVKSPYELSRMKESGRQHKILMEDIIPSLLREGINEAELTAKIYEKMIGLGYHGLSRFGSFQTEMIVGQIGFGENSVYPTNFDGPGGMRGMSPAVPIVGDKNRRLKKGDLVFVDIGYGVDGYHSDRTQVYMYQARVPKEAADYHRKCMQIQKDVSKELKPGNIPSDIYTLATCGLDEDFTQGFMGMGNERVKFLGHGIGLQIDEYPVIAKGFDEPLEENMVIAVEPKRRIPGFGTVGAEDTYIVTKCGGECITGGEKEIIELY